MATVTTSCNLRYFLEIFGLSITGRFLIFSQHTNQRVGITQGDKKAEMYIKHNNSCMLEDRSVHTA